MYESDSLYWHTNRRVAAPIHDSISALDMFAWQASVWPASPYASLFTRPIASPRRVLTSERRRSFVGRVRTGPVTGVPVELDLTAWSGTDSALGLRPSGRKPPVVRAARYFAVAHALLEDLAIKIDLLVHAFGGPHSDMARRIARVLTVTRDAPSITGLVTSLS